MTPEIGSGNAKINKEFIERIPETFFKFKLGPLLSCNTCFFHSKGKKVMNI